MSDILDGWTTVTKASHPVLFQAFEVISHDRGSGAGHTNYSVPPKWAIEVDGVEAALSSLDKEALETLCIVGRSKASDVDRDGRLKQANALLNDFYDDWSLSDD
jgi:hypothetical protein